MKLLFDFFTYFSSEFLDVIICNLEIMSAFDGTGN